MPTLETLSPESTLILAVAKPELTPAQAQECRDLLAEHHEALDFGAFVDQAARHGVLPLIGRNMLRHHVNINDENRCVVPYCWLYSGAYTSNRSRNRAISDDTGHLLRALAAHGVKYAVRKGPVLAEHRYRDIGVRHMGDIDILVNRADLPACAEALSERGFHQGKLDRNRTRVIPFERATRMFWQLNLNNELPYVKPADHDDVDQYSVDLCLSIFPVGGNYPDTDELLDRAVDLTLCGTDARALSLEDELLDLCVHLHKEATSLRYIKAGTDLTLRKFQDVALTCAEMDKRGDWPLFHRRAVDAGVAEHVYFSLHHTKILFDGLVPGAVLDALRPANLDYLDEYGHADGAPGRWEIPFLTRLFDVGRRSRVSGSTTIPFR
ncbi:hypothetical protein F4560_000043 [Saccharothrix ecbatanensis]|uniref:Uncharacterized protein n=1 Tax=Saccharothrix ecbatanensis TaxID=1105145 RepID=A0A7W9LXX2_9PSEU|nr:nucleotidyltransferase family protein [Saccharothrix ecbatanensis]MBB5800275.1 hypothetical protein [Saccharothrix ecbatanensis]